MTVPIVGGCSAVLNSARRPSASATGRRRGRPGRRPAPPALRDGAAGRTRGLAGRQGRGPPTAGAAASATRRGGVLAVGLRALGAGRRRQHRPPGRGRLGETHGLGRPAARAPRSRVAHRHVGEHRPGVRGAAVEHGRQHAQHVAAPGWCSCGPRRPSPAAGRRRGARASRTAAGSSTSSAAVRRVDASGCRATASSRAAPSRSRRHLGEGASRRTYSRPALVSSRASDPARSMAAGSRSTPSSVGSRAIAAGTRPEQHVVHRQLERVRVEPERERQAGLRVEVHQQHPLPQLGQGGAERGHRGGLGDAALLVGDGERDRHGGPFRSGPGPAYCAPGEHATVPRSSGRVRDEPVLTARGAFAALQAGPDPSGDLRPVLLVPGFTGSKEDFVAVLAPILLGEIPTSPARVSSAVNRLPRGVGRHTRFLEQDSGPGTSGINLVPEQPGDHREVAGNAGDLAPLPCPLRLRAT